MKNSDYIGTSFDEVRPPINRTGNYITRHIECANCKASIAVWNYVPYNHDSYMRVLLNGEFVNIGECCWNRLVNTEILWTVRGWNWLPTDGPFYRGLQEARWIIRDAQKIVTSADTWAFLSDALNYLDARIDNMKDSIGISDY